MTDADVLMFIRDLIGGGGLRYRETSRNYQASMELYEEEPSEGDWWGLTTGSP